MLELQFRREAKQQTYARVRDVLVVIGKGALLSAAFLAPNSIRITKTLMQQSHGYNDWKQFNASFLRRTLKRLATQKIIEESYVDGKTVLTLTEAGRQKILKYSISALDVPKPSRWDGYWRLVLYDIDKDHNHLRDIVRDTLNSIGFYQIQESVFLYPYACDDQIEFLRDYYRTEDMIQYMTVLKIEHDDAYKSYFGLN